MGNSFLSIGDQLGGGTDRSGIGVRRGQDGKEEDQGEDRHLELLGSGCLDSVEKGSLFGNIVALLGLFIEFWIR